MKRSATPLHLIAAGAAASSSTVAVTPPIMSSRTSYRGGRRWGRGWRNYSDSSRGEGGDYPPQFITGDSHFRQVQDANRGFRPPYNEGNFSNSQPSPNFAPRPNNYQPRPQHPQYPQPLPSQHQHFDQNQQTFRRPPFRNDLNQQFRPHWQQQKQPQQFKPRPPKDLEYRNWEYAKPGPPSECERFKILSYNILADYLAADHRHNLYFHIPNYMMDWEWRKRSILFELGLWSADILCFQEVDRFQDLKEELGLRGYSGVWKMRTGNPVDGCAIFWRNSRFKLLHEESIEFNTLGLRDNVAQICVFESLYQCKDSGAEAPSLSSLKNANKIVVCNIHVLFNPKRGEIKLGQIEINEGLNCIMTFGENYDLYADALGLLDKIKILSTLQDNSSEYYRNLFFYKQIRVLLSRAHAVSKLWDDAPVTVCGDFNSTPKSPLYNFIAEQKLDLSELPRDLVSGQASAEVNPSRSSNPDPRAQSTGKIPQVLPAASHVRTKNCDSPLAIQKQDYADESSGNGTYGDTLSESFSSVVVEAVESCTTINYANEEVDKLSRENELEIFDGCHGENESTVGASHSDSEIPGALWDETASSGSPVKDAIHDSCLLVVKMESLSFNEIHVDRKELEDKNSLLSKMHHAGGPFPSQLSQSQRSNSEVESFKECASSENQGLYSLGSEILNNSPGVDPEIIDMEQSKYDPSAWTPVEIEAATGSSDCVMMEHPLKLLSVYREIEDCSGTRDSTGEPSVTSYHRRFFGTVDYIWRSEGLQTSKVLAPIPKHAMKWTQGFPTKKWGSDHIALVSELAFRNDVSSRINEVQLQNHVQHSSSVLQN